MFAAASLDLGFGDGEQGYGPPSCVAPVRVQTNLTSTTNFPHRCLLVLKVSSPEDLNTPS